MSRSERRVVVTGMGVMSAVGIGVQATWDGLVAGRSGVTRIDSFEPERVDSKIAASVGEFDASHVLDRKELRRADRYTQLGLVAAREALDQAGLPGRLEGALAEATGIILGTGLGGVNTLCEQIEINATRGPGPGQPVLRADGHPERRRRPAVDHLRRPRPELRDRVGLCHGRPRDRRIVGDHPPRRRRHHGCRRGRGRRPEALVAGFCAMRALSTRNDDPSRSLPAIRCRPGWVRDRRGLRDLVLEERQRHAWRGAPSHWPS